jgi:hypothetical protein
MVERCRLAPSRTVVVAGTRRDHQTTDLFIAWQNSFPSDRRRAMRIVPPAQHPEVTRRFEQGRVYSPQGFEAVALRPKGD